MLVNTIKILKSSSGTPSQSQKISQNASNKSDSKLSKAPAKSSVRLNSQQESVSIPNSNSKVQKGSDGKIELNSGSKSQQIQEIKLFDQPSSKYPEHSRSKSPSKSGNKSTEKEGNVIRGEVENGSLEKSHTKSSDKPENSSPSKSVNKSVERSDSKSPSKSNAKAFFKSLFRSNAKPSASHQESIPQSSPEEEDYDPHNIKNINSTPYIKIIKKHPEYINPTVEKIYRLLGKFDVDVNYTIKLMYKKQIMINKDKSIYTGFIDKKGRPSDVGVMVWPSGVLHEGRFSVGQAWGHGRRITVEGIIYEGDWDDGLLEGQGRIESSTMLYIGSVSKNLPHGIGTERWQNGDIFEGEFFEGKKNGKGKFTWQNGSRYEGMVENNTIHGMGTYIWQDGRIYIGEWKKNMMDGEGRFEWPDGRVYQGQFAKGKREGYGILDWPNKNRFEGIFKKGKYEGEGTLYMPDNNKIITAIYNDGQLVKILNEREYIKPQVIVYSIIEPQVLVMPPNSPPLEQLKEELEVALKPVEVPPPIIILKADDETIRIEFDKLYGPFANHPLYKKLLLLREKWGPFIYDFPEFDFDVDVYFYDWALYPDGYYKGEMNELKLRHGRGVFVDKCSIYEGYFRDNKFDGPGRYYDIYEIVYEGYWNKGLKSGFGCLWIKDISFYCGEWERGFKHGVGRLEEVEYTYEGEFDIDIMQGKGRIDWKTSCSYKGDFKKNLPHGYGVYVSFDGQGFTGVWRKGHLTKAATNARNDVKKIENDSNMSVPSILSVQTPRSHNSFNELPSIEIKPPPMDRDSILDSSHASRVHFGALPKPMKRSKKPAERDSLLFDPNHSQVRFSKSSGPIRSKPKAVDRDSILFEPNDSFIKFPASTGPANSVKRMEERDSLLFDPTESRIYFGRSGKPMKFIKDAVDRDSFPSESEASNIRFGEVSEYSIEDSIKGSIKGSIEDSIEEYNTFVDSEPEKLDVSICPREMDIPEEMSINRLDDPRFEDNVVPSDSFSINVPIINSINSFASEYNKIDYSDDDFELNRVYLNTSHVKRPLDSAKPEMYSNLEPENKGGKHVLRNLTIFERLEIVPRSDKSSVTIARFDRSDLKNPSAEVSKYEPIYERQDESRYIATETDLKGRADNFQDLEAWSDIEEEKISIRDSYRANKIVSPDVRAIRSSTHLLAKFPSPLPSLDNERERDSQNSAIQSYVDTEMFDASIISKDMRRDELGLKSPNLSLSSTSYIKFPTPSNKHTEASYRPNFTEESDQSYLRYLKEHSVRGEYSYEKRNKYVENISEPYSQHEVLSRQSDQIDQISEFDYQPGDLIHQVSKNEEYSVDSQEYISSSIKSRKSKQKRYNESYQQEEVSFSQRRRSGESDYYKDKESYKSREKIKHEESYYQSESSQSISMNHTGSYANSSIRQSKKPSGSYDHSEILYSRTSQNKIQEASAKICSNIASEAFYSYQSSIESSKSKQSSVTNSKSKSLHYDESYTKQGDSSKLEYQHKSSEYLHQAPSISNSIDEDPEDLMRGFSYSQYSEMVVSDKSQSYFKHRREKDSGSSVDQEVQSSERRQKRKKKHKRSDKRSDESDADGYREKRSKKKNKHNKRRDSDEGEYEEDRKEALSGMEEQDSEQEKRIKKKEKNRDRSFRYISEKEAIEDSGENIQQDSSYRSEDRTKSKRSHRRSKKEIHEE